MRGSNPGRDEIFRTRPDQSLGPRSLLHNGYRVSYSGVTRPGCGVDHPHHVAPRLKKNRPITLLLLWAFMASSRVNYTYTLVQ